MNMEIFIKKIQSKKKLCVDVKIDKSFAIISGEKRENTFFLIITKGNCSKVETANATKYAKVALKSFCLLWNRKNPKKFLFPIRKILRIDLQSDENFSPVNLIGCTLKINSSAHWISFSGSFFGPFWVRLSPVWVFFRSVLYPLFDPIFGHF